LTRFAPKEPSRGIGLASALLIGTIQGLAIAPGISRSGTTIAAALFRGVEREEAARFSFLLSVPSIIGALLVESGGALNGIGAATLILGFLAAALTGYLCLALLVQLVKRNQLSVFSYYCWALGLIAIFLIG
jgi:undecaprenyl-diphosphatase